MIEGRMGVKTIDVLSIYLGLPTFVGKSKKQIFANLLDKLQKKLRGWKALTLSQGARKVLIKSIAQAFPTYLICCFALPMSICHDLESIINNYWWDGCEDVRNIHWVSWMTLCLPKAKGGLDFRRMHQFNQALLAKQG